MAIFLDTNILIYAYSNDEVHKREMARSICSLPNSIISTLVLIEFTNIANKKMGVSWPSILNLHREVLDNFQIHTTKASTIAGANRIAEYYQLPWFDSLIVQAAIDANCTILFSEDLNTGQVFENQLKVVNPFK